MIDPLSSGKIKPWHLEGLAFVYVRQSDPQQIVKNPESTARQYALVDHAVALGWPRHRVVVIDDDQGKTASTAEGRLGFHYLLGEVALGHAGIILGTEVSRPARCCKDWYQLLELCARFGTLLGDSDGLYDPGHYNDRLLLGLKGMMSEAELHILKERMNEAKLHKARRGELSYLPPVGYVRTPEGGFAMDPDEEVQAALRLVFDQFDRHATVYALLRYLVGQGILLPVRSRLLANRGQLHWRQPSYNTLLSLLHHPIYAGAYRYGHRAIAVTKQQPGRRGTGKQCLPSEECLVLLRDRVPAYITWERFEANQRKMQANRTNQDALGAPRQGAALLSGLICCGKCQRRMMVHYKGRPQAATYDCRGDVYIAGPRCQSVSARAVDELVAGQILRVAEPAALEASLAAVADIEQERAALLRQWNLKIERADYEEARARRQYHACEPENRLVARTLERRWEEALQHQRQLQEEFQRWKQATPSQLSAPQREAIRELASDLPALWQAATTTAQERKQIARLLLERVTVIVDKESDQVNAKLQWMGGAQTEHVLARPVARYSQQAGYARLVSRLKELCREGLSSSEIATKLNAEGFRPARRAKAFNGAMVSRLRKHWGLSRGVRHGSKEGLGKQEYRPAGLAQKLGVPRETVKRWMRRGWVNVRQDGRGHHIVWADADELRRLRALHRLPRTAANRERLAALQKPKQRPTR
ncbi:MAG TPA: recombinase family protein [Gemmataceae bacterium]|jgi:DNA invertase Pin-like site-specific DNA recombinase|nr:recombinase family protein [Gemmataceae bacterium]